MDKIIEARNGTMTRAAFLATVAVGFPALYLVLRGMRPGFDIEPVFDGQNVLDNHLDLLRATRMNAIVVETGRAFADEVFRQALTEQAKLLELNSHAIERRGRDLAMYIWQVVDAAFNHSNDPNNPYNELVKRVLCGAAGIVEGCSIVMQFMVEVPSRSVAGAVRTASVLFGLDDATGEWRVITALYKDSPVEKLAKRFAAQGMTEGLCSDLRPPPPGLLFATN